MRQNLASDVRGLSYHDELRLRIELPRWERPRELLIATT